MSTRGLHWMRSALDPANVPRRGAFVAAAVAGLSLFCLKLVRARRRRRRAVSEPMDEQSSDLKLVYFDTRSVAEPLRLALAVAGVPYVDERLPCDAEGYAEVARRRAEGLNGPGGCVPVLYVGGKARSQSKALLRYVGRRWRGSGHTPGWVGYPEDVEEQVR